jgi:hypothetical protein
MDVLPIFNFKRVNKKRENMQEVMTSTGDKIEVKEKQPVKQTTMSQADFSGYGKDKKKGK